MKHRSWSIASPRLTPTVGDRSVRAVRAIRRTTGQSPITEMLRMQMGSVEMDKTLMGTWRTCYCALDRVKIRRVNTELVRERRPPSNFPLVFSYGFLKVMPSSNYLD